FQAEDGIRDFHVTGVQTCALPILTTANGCSKQEAPAYGVSYHQTPKNAQTQKRSDSYPVATRWVSSNLTLQVCDDCFKVWLRSPFETLQPCSHFIDQALWELELNGPMLPEKTTESGLISLTLSWKRA